MTSTEKLVQALREANAPQKLIRKARKNHFHDFKSESATPIVDLVRLCTIYGLDDIAERAKNGEYDATREESDEWARSPEAQKLFEEMGPMAEKLLGVPKVH